jgi:diguanylate cyclase (GGDEF)-like protein/PAS domain S-box-containing protein
VNLVVQAWTTVGALAAAAAAALLWHGSSRYEPSVKRGYRWLAVAAALWGSGLIAQDALGTPLAGAAVPLTLADLLSLLALPPLVLGVATLTAAGQDPGPPATGRLGGGLARLADGCLLGAALFIIGWLALFASDYTRAGVGAGAFAADLLRPLADLTALGIVLAFAVRAGWRGLLPGLALLTVAVGDALAVSAQVSASPVGAWPLLAWITGLCLLGAAVLVQPDRPDQVGFAGWRLGQVSWAGSALATVVAAAAVATAAAVTIGWALAGGSSTEPVLTLTVAVAVLVLVLQVAVLVRRASAVSAFLTESGRQLRELADRTSDVVLVCELDGVICYASLGVAEFGYAAGNLAGQSLFELVHPEDRTASGQLAAAAASSDGRAGRYSCRIRSADGTWRHVESTISRYREAGAPDRLLVTVRDLTDEVALRRQVTHLTFHDGLTGLPNRAYLEERAKGVLSGAARAARQVGQPGAEAGAIFLDLDGFTAVNDSVGHGAGDLLLAQAARRMRASVPPQDTVARWGGDEFAILIESGATVQEIVDIAERLAGAIAAEPFQVADRDISLTASIGVALASGDHSGHLLRNADVAMSRAKDSGGGRVEVFASHMHADVMRRLELASDLRLAITREQLAVEYQPVVELAGSQVTAVEALVRWTRGQDQVRPAEFLGVAEYSGLIVPLGYWVLREACRQAAAWRASGWNIGVSVNFSLRQVSAAAFAESVLAAVEDSGLAPEALTLEVSERVLIEAAEPMVAGLAELRRRGIRLAIDDFGTGYASLAYLRRLAVDVIKIDPSFVAGLGNDATLAMLTRTIIQVGNDMGIEVVAEGIERPEQLELLRAMGCSLGQGYLVARPMTARAIEALAGLPRQLDSPGQVGSPGAPAPAPAG